MSRGKMTKIETLPAIRAAEKVLEIIIDLAPDEIQEALSAIGKAGATWGLLWGLENLKSIQLLRNPDLYLQTP